MNECLKLESVEGRLDGGLWVSLNSELPLVAYGFAKLVCRFVQCFSLENRVAASRATTP